MISVATNSRAMHKLGIATHDIFKLHDAGPDHPEYYGRLEVILNALRKTNWWGDVKLVEAREASVEEVTYVHNPKYVEAMRRLCDAGGQFLPSMDAAVGEISYPVALRAVGAGLTLADGVLSGEYQMGYGLVRPPGHHAIFARPWGFCIFNNIAILAQYLINKHNLERIAIFDFDVHHGNGTEQAFWTESRIFYCSIHQADYFPSDTGDWHDRGEGDGEGYTVNIPMKARSGDEDYLKAIQRYALPAVLDYKPEILLVSVGFDGHWRDIVANTKLSGKGYYGIGKCVKKMASGSANGRIIAMQEGGYDLIGNAEGANGFFQALIEEE